MGSKGKTPQDIRQANHELIFKLLRKKHALSCTELAKEIKLSNTAVEKITDSLCGKGFLKHHSENHPKVKGRRPIRYGLNKDACSYVSLNFTDGVYSICDFCGNVLSEDALQIERFADEASLKAVFSRISAAAKKFGCDIVSVSASLVGKADSKTGEVETSKLFKRGVNLAEILRDCFGVPSSVTNDTYLAFISELEQRKTDNAVYVYIGKGISCAFIIGGKIFTGGSGLAGEIGQFPAGDGTVESLLNPNKLFELDEKVQAGDGGDVRGVVEPLISALAVTVRLLDLSDVIISCPYKNLRGYIVDTLNGLFALHGLNKSRVDIAKNTNISEGLNVHALSFCHNEVIKHQLRQ